MGRCVWRGWLPAAGFCVLHHHKALINIQFAASPLDERRIFLLTRAAREIRYLTEFEILAIPRITHDKRHAVLLSE